MTLTELNDLERQAKAEVAAAEKAAAMRSHLLDLKANNSSAIFSLVGAARTDSYGTVSSYLPAIHGANHYNAAREAVEAVAAIYRNQMLDQAMAGFESKARDHLLRAQIIRAQIDTYLTKPEDTK